MTDDDLDSPIRDLELIRLMRDADRQPFTAPALPGDRAMVGRVTTVSGMAVGKYLTVNPVRLLGPEVEGGAGTLSVQTSASIPVYLVGPGVPTTGADLICRRLGHRWAADYDTVSSGGGSVVFPGCGCPLGIPTTFTMTVVTGSPSPGSVYPSATFLYQPQPAIYSGSAYPAMMLLSEYFDDGAPYFFGRYRYYFECYPGNYSIRKIYDNPFGSGPYADSIHVRWYLSSPGNTCVPFRLASVTEELPGTWVITVNP